MLLMLRRSDSDELIRLSLLVVLNPIRGAYADVALQRQGSINPLLDHREPITKSCDT